MNICFIDLFFQHFLTLCTWRFGTVYTFGFSALWYYFRFASVTFSPIPLSYSLTENGVFFFLQLNIFSVCSVLAWSASKVWRRKCPQGNLGEFSEGCIVLRVRNEVWYCRNRVSSCNITYIVQQDTRLLLWLNIYSQYVWQLDMFRTYRSILRSINQLCVVGLVCADWVLLGASIR